MTAKTSPLSALSPDTLALVVVWGAVLWAGLLAARVLMTVAS